MNIFKSRKTISEEYVNLIKKKIHDKFCNELNKMSISDFVLGEIRYNYRCFFNSCHYYKVRPEEYTVHLVYGVDSDGGGFLHVINKKNSIGKFQDNTLGYIFAETDYYYIKEIPKETLDMYDGIGTFFKNYRIRLLEPFIDQKKAERLNLDPWDFI